MMERLIEAIDRKQAPVVVGLDPTMSLIPDTLQEKAVSRHGKTLEAAAEAVWAFNRQVIDGIAELVPAVKPQLAMYEQFGLPGLSVYQKTSAYCREKGLLVLADGKRGDIGSTSAAYSTAHLGRLTFSGETLPVFDADFLTVNPYLGSDGVRPFLADCEAFDKGIFVLVKTSNPSSGELQDKTVDGTPLYEQVGDLVEAWGASIPFRHQRYSEVGAVVGATYPEMGARLRKRMPHTFFLVPGYGAQGAGAEELAGFFDENGQGALVNSSRGILGAWQRGDCAGLSVAEAARKAAEEMIADLRRVLP